MAHKYLCRKCQKLITGTTRNRYRTHTDGKGDPCGNTGEIIPADLKPDIGAADTPKEGMDFALCPSCDRNVKLTNLGYFEPHNTTLNGGERCPLGGVRASNVRKTDDNPLPGDEVPPRGVMATWPRVTAQQEMESTPSSTSGTDGSKSTPTAPLMLTAGPDSDSPYVELLKTELGATVLSETFLDLADSPDLYHEEGEQGQPIEALSAPSAASGLNSTSSPESPTTSTPWREWTEASDSFFLETVHAILMDALAAEPPSSVVVLTESATASLDSLLFAENPKGQGKVPVQPMGDLAKELATRIKETFYAYSNRRTKDNRSNQTTLGPSEIGTPCDRRLAMALMNIPPVNAGGDGWAAFVGTCTHAGMAEVYTFADAGTGRYAVEMPVFLGVPTVPKGTTDLLDRRDGTVVDWKVMGFSSLKKFKEKGPSETYRTQGHVYGLGAERAGEKVRNVAIVGLPRGGFSLDEMHIWTEKYDRKLAQAALDRVESIADRIGQLYGGAEHSQMDAAAEFEPADDCTYCPFFLRGDKEMSKGCPGK